MTWLSDRTLDHLREVADEPDLSGTRYRLLEPVGRGGMGRVYRARDTGLDRDVALKVLHTHEAAAADRLIAEARILARLEHPGIVPVHDAGTLPDGRVFCAMKLVRGKRLDALAREPDVDLPERLRIFQRICETVAFAHAHGVLHRDLKPQNVMVGAYGEVLVLDWGIAKLTPQAQAATAEGDTPPESTDPESGFTAPESADPESGSATHDAPPRGDTDPESGLAAGNDHPAQANADSVLAPARAQATRRDPRPVRDPSRPSPRPSPVPTQVGTRIGTPGWMAPEQEHGQIDRITERTDVFGLGAILRDLLETSPRDGGAKPPARLRAIVDRATASSPADRYAGVDALSTDVRRFLAGLSVSAYREPFVERAIRLARKYRTPILLVLTYLVMRVLFIVFADA
jgi:serine/threonine protein kinase